jgi:hypothetical protein
MLCQTFLKTLFVALVSSNVQWSYAQASSCNSTQIVTSLSEITDALSCAQEHETTEIIINSNISIEDSIPFVNISYLTVRGVTEDAALEYHDNSNSRRLLYIVNSTVNFESLALRGDPNMGCMVLSHSQVHMQAVDITSLPHEASLLRNDGLGVHLMNSTVVLEDSSVSGWTHANYGAGFFLQFNSTLTLIRTSLLNNDAILEGGAVYVSEGCALSVYDNCLFAFNTALRKGGAVHVQSDSVDAVIMRDSMFVNNSASNGGAVSVERVPDSPLPADLSVFTFENVSFDHNSARSFGGGLRLAAGGVLANVTFDYNTAYEAGQ